MRKGEHDATTIWCDRSARLSMGWRWDGSPPFKRALGLNFRPGAVAEKLLHRPRYQIAILDTFSGTDALAGMFYRSFLQ